ncbi:MAG: aldo/keto reductase [Frankiales bacterium]|nr:aldo/keto reductase [Frankiales bacterium]
MTSLPTTTAPLTSGASIPLLGFGTWQITGDTAREATAAALSVGYRHLDTATVYGNEGEVGAGLADSGLAREDVFLTSKVPPGEAGRAREVLKTSLELLGVDALDLWLIHWTEGGADRNLWAELVQAQADGLVRDVGVSNHSLEQVDELAHATGVRPSVNQVKWSPYLYDAALLAGHRERGVVVEGYSGLKGGTLDEPAVRAVAERTGRTPAQVLIAWQLQHGVVVLPKSTRPERIRENGDVGDLVLSDDDMAAIDGLAGSR